MHTITLRQVGGSTMLAIPPSLLRSLDFGDKVNLSTQNGKLIIEKAVTRPSYTLEELLAQCDTNQPLDNELQSWVNDDMTGKELI